ncbi:MAG: hypothetical protein K2I23_01160 [Clostridia bacterium]|nr:hypothetical protein [Clostridia bacterium]
MAQRITTKKFAKNVLVSIGTQVISMAVSFLLSLIVPKYIGKISYADWQTYVLYVGYVGVLHFGLLDGIVLRYAKYDYEELDKARLRSQFTILLVFTSIVTISVAAISLSVLTGSNRLIFALVAVGVITKNMVTYGLYMLQITNRIGKYAISVIAQRLTYGIVVVILLALRVDDFVWYCVADLCGDFAGIVVGMFFNRGLYLGRTLAPKEAFKELGTNIASGIVLMMANWSAMLMVGSAKMIIQWHWDKITFGQVSFAFSASNVFLTFITAISVVLFPSLKRIDQEKLPVMYKKIREILSPLLFFAMIFYFVGCKILEVWLPQYTDSLIWLGVLLPLIIYTSKVSLLTNNYLKVYRKEKTMLVVNLISIVVGILTFVLGAYVFNNLYVVLGGVVFVIMLNSILSEICVLRIIKVKIIAEFIVEATMTLAFILCACLCSRLVGFLIYLGAFAIYCLINYKSILSNLKNIFKRKRGENL